MKSLESATVVGERTASMRAGCGSGPLVHRGVFDQGPRPRPWLPRVLLSVAFIGVTGCGGYVAGATFAAGAEPRVVYIDRPATATATPSRVPASIARGPLRVLLAGDSTSVESEQAWSNVPGVELVGAEGRNGCPLIQPDSGWSVMYTPFTIDHCDWRLYVPQAVAGVAPDVVVASWGGFIPGDYRRADGSVDWVREGGPVLDVVRASMSEFETAVAPARVVWVTYPATELLSPDWVRLADEARNDALWPLVFDGHCSADMDRWLADSVAGPLFHDGVHLNGPVQTAAVGWLSTQLVCP